ncbi:MAG: hypothetical protein ACXIVF_13820 [Rhizobiaceae bacterium]
MSAKGLGIACLMVLLASPLVAAAQEAQIEQEARLAIELNALQPSDRGCRVTFVAANHLEGDLDRAAYELAFFDTDGLVARLAVVDFLDLDQGRTRVRQFEFAGMDCDAIGRILINDLAECSGTGIEAASCMSRLALDNKTSIQFGT